MPRQKAICRVSSWRLPSFLASDHSMLKIAVFTGLQTIVTTGHESEKAEGTSCGKQFHADPVCFCLLFARTFLINRRHTTASLKSGRAFWAVGS